MTTHFSKKIATLLLACIFTGKAPIWAQNAGINSTGATPNASAGLDVDFTNKGVLIPRLALTITSSAAPVTSPATSLIVYNTATVADVTPGFYYWDGVKWVRLINSGFSTGSDWLLAGNTNTNPPTDFIGTTDAKDFVVKTAGTSRMYVRSGGVVNIVGDCGIGTTIAPAGRLQVDQGTGTATGVNIVCTGNATGTGTALNISKSGNPTGAFTSYGLQSSVTTTTNSTNVAGYFSASGGATANYAIVVPNTGGNVGIGLTNPDANASLDIETTNRRILGLFGNGNIITATDGSVQAGVVVGPQFTPSVSTTYVAALDPYVNVAPGAGVTISNAYGLRVRGTKSGAGTVTNGYGVHVDMSPGYGTNKYAGVFLNGNVGIGTATPPSWLSVSSSFSGAPSLFYGKFSDFGYNSTFTDNTTAASGTALGVWFNHFAAPTLAASNTNVTTNYAATVMIDGAPIKGTNNTVTDNVALRINLTNSGAHTRSYGLWVEAPQGAGANYAAYLNGMVGISKLPAFTLDINGTANCTSNTWTSDVRKKKDIRTLDLNALNLIDQLRPVSFEWIEQKDDGMIGTQMGFIAQELEKILPSMVVTANDKERSKAVKYNELLPVLVKAIQEQQIMIAEQQALISRQNSRIEALEEVNGIVKK